MTKIEKLLTVASIVKLNEFPTDLSLMFNVVPEESNKILEDNRLFIGEVSEKDILTVNSIIAGKHKFIRAYNKMMDLYGSPNILEVDKGLQSLIDFDFTDYKTLAVACGYSMIDNSMTPEGFKFGRNSETVVVVYRFDDNNKYSLAFVDMHNLMTSVSDAEGLQSYLNKMQEVTLKNISNNTSLALNTLYKITA